MNRFAALDPNPVAEVVPSTSWGDEEPCTTSSTPKVTNIPLAKAVSEAFGGDKAIYGRVFDRRNPLLNEKEWETACIEYWSHIPVSKPSTKATDGNTDGFTTVKHQKKTVVEDRVRTMERSLALAWVKPRVLEALEKTAQFSRERSERDANLLHKARIY